jgi:hypothetical protein
MWILVLVLVAGCFSVEGPEISGTFAVTPGLDEPFTLEVGERARVDGANLYLRFLDVASDSRCPSNALILCVWQGDAAVVIEIGPLVGDAAVDTLHTTLEPKSVPVSDGVLVLQHLAPYPEDVTPIPIGEYVATFVVESLSRRESPSSR